MEYVSKEQYERLKKIADRKKKEEEEKKSSSSASSASSSKKVSTKSSSTSSVNSTTKTSKKTSDFATSASKNLYSSPFYSAYQQSKKEKKTVDAYKRYATGEIDSTVAENMGVNTGEVDNITNKMSRRQINQAFKPTQSTTNQEKKAETDYSERPTTTRKIYGGKVSGAPTYFSATPKTITEAYKFSSDEDYAEYLRNEKELKQLKQKNLNTHGISYEEYSRITTRIDALEKRNKELVRPYEERIAKENTDYLDTLPLGEIGGEYTRLEAGYRDENGNKITDGDEYKDFQKYYFYRLANDAGINPEFKKYYNEKAISDFPKLEYKGNVTGTRLDANTKALKLNSYYEYMTPEERHYFNYLGTTEDGSLLQNDYAEMLLPNLMTRKANETPASNPFMQVVESYASGVGKSMDDAAKGVQQTFGIGNYWKDEEPQYGTVKNQVDTANAGTLQKIANMAANSTGYMTPSLVTSYLTGGASAASALGGKALKAASMAPMFLSSSGSTYSDALNSGVSNEQARARGFLKGLSEVGTQSVLGGISKFGGNRLGSALAKTGAGEKAVKMANNVVDKLKNPYVKATLVNTGKIAGNASSEMFEEYLQDYVIAPLIENMTGGNAKLDLWDENSLYTLATAAISASAFNAPSDVANITSDFKKAGEINRSLQGFQQSPIHNAENLASPFDVSEKQSLSDQVSSENTNVLTEQNRGGLEGDVSNYSPETQDVLSKLTTAGRNLLLSGKMSAAQIDSLANEINDPTSENNSKSARRERIKNALDEVNWVIIIEENNSNPDNVQIDPKKHNLKQQKTIIEYNNSTNPELLKYLKEMKKRFKEGRNTNYPKKFGKVNNKNISDIKKLLGIDTTGYKFELLADRFLHIEKRHGKKGKADSSLSNFIDIARIEYILNNYDTISLATESDIKDSVYRNSDNTLAKKLVITKKIDGTYVVTEVVPDSNRKVIGVVTARIENNKNDSAAKSSNAGVDTSNTPLEPTSETNLSHITVGNSIPQTDPTVNPENSQNPTPRPQVEGIPAPAAQDNSAADGGATVPPRSRPEGITENYDNTNQFLMKSPEKVPSDKEMTNKEKFTLERTDSLGAVKDIAKKSGSNSLYQSAQAAKHGRSMAEYALTAKQTDAYGNEVGKSVAEILSPIIDTEKGNFKAEYPLFQKYLHNYNFEGREAAGKKNLADDMILSKEEMSRLEQEHPEFKQMADDIFEFIKNGQDYMVETGIWSEEFRDELRAKYPYYLPSHRLMENADNKNNFFSSATDISNLIKTATGSEKTILPIHEELIDYANAMYTQGTTNQFFNALADGWRAMQANDPKRPHIYDVKPYQKGMAMPEYSMSFYKDGQRYVMEMDEYLYEGLNDLMNMGKKIDPDMLTTVAKLFKAVTTDMNPVFAIAKNPPKDAQTAIANSEHPGHYALNVVRYGLKTVTGRLDLKNDKSWQLYKARGNTDTGLVEISDKTNFYSKRDRSGLKAYRYVTDSINKIASFFEQTFRFLEFKATLDAEGLTKKIENGEKLTAADLEIINRASYNAAKVTADFNTAGTKIRELNRKTPYLNAQIQGNAQYFRNFADAKITASNPKQAVTRMMYRTAMYGGAAAVQFALLAKREEDEEYQKLSNSEKEKYNYFLWEGKPIFKWPRNEFQQVIYSFGDIITSIKEGTDYQSIIGKTMQFLGSFVPTPFTSHMAYPLVRAGLISENSGLTWRGSDIESKSMQNKAVADRYDEDTTELAKWLSKYLLSGIGASPAEIDDVFNSYLGGVWDVTSPFLRAKTWKSEKPGEEIKKAFSEPFTKQFVPQNKLQRSGVAGKFYDTKTMYSQTAAGDNATTLDAYMSKFVNSNDKDISALETEYKDKETGNVSTPLLIGKDKESELLELKNQKEALMSDIINNVPKYRAAAEKVLANYPNYSYDPDNDRYNSYIKMQIDCEYGGAEYALKELNSEVYKKAQEINSENGVSYEDIYKYQLKKKSLPKDIKSSEETKQLEDWLLDEVSSKRMDNKSASALASVYLKKETHSSETLDYDFSSRESMTVSKMEPTAKERYEIAKGVFSGMTAEKYEYYRQAYNTGETKAEKLNALHEAGMTENAALIFHKIQSGAKGYKTSSSPETQLRNSLNLHSQSCEKIVREYKNIIHSDPDEEDRMHREYLQKLIKNRLPDGMRKYYGDEKIFNTMYNILSVY